MNKRLYRARLRLGVELKRITRRRFADRLNPFREADRPSIVHCCYHKVGTVWFLRVLREVAAHFGLSFGTGDDYERIRSFETDRSIDVFLDYGSHVQLHELGRYVGSHMIRDPRDMLVSAYFYHLWTPEPWAHLPRAEYRGMSYQEHLNRLTKDEGLLAEMDRMSFWINHMADWDYRNPRMYEIRYEEIMEDEPRIMREMFRHYGFTDRAIEESCEIAAKYTFERMSGRKEGGNSHLRSGRTSEWRDHFNEEHKRRFKQLYPNVLSVLGYESEDDW